MREITSGFVVGSRRKLRKLLLRLYCLTTGKRIGFCWRNDFHSATDLVRAPVRPEHSPVAKCWIVTGSVGPCSQALCSVQFGPQTSVSLASRSGICH